MSEASTKFSIKNWDDWFRNCGEIQDDLAQYEQVMAKYYNTLAGKNPDRLKNAQAEYEKHHKTAFYDSEKHIPLWYIIRSILVGAGSFAGLMILFGILNLMKHMDGGPAFKAAILPSAIISVLVIAAMVGIFFLVIKNLCAKMHAIEVKIADRVAYLPPKYRNSQAAQAIYDMFTSYGVMTFNQAIAACDDYLISNNYVGAYMAEMFDEPYSNKLNSAGGQNNHRSAASEETEKDDEERLNDPALPNDIKTKIATGIEDADAELDKLIGLENVKDQIRQMKNRMDFYGSDKNQGISGNHMIFLGPPGTGKTTIARIITKMLYDFGYIKQNRLIEIDGAYLKSPYVGQTAERSAAIIRFAMGGVLFIDEAYLLHDEKQGPATEAMGVLLKTMEDNKEDIVIIMAGYEDDMNRLISSNEGLSSRIKYKVYFDDFTTEELAAIFRLQMKNYDNQYKIEKSAFEMLTDHFDAERQAPGFGNARVVRNAFDQILDMHADHFMRKEIPEEKKYILTKKDVEAYIEVRKKQMQEDTRNYIASRQLDSTVVSFTELKEKTHSGSEDPDKDLQNLVGLETVKEEIRQMKAQYEFYDGNLESEGNHMVFYGPPGTGKTTVAAIMTGYLYKLGLIRDNAYLDINGDFLRGMYVGHTGKRTEAVIQYCQGMVLFLDEAYLLSSMDGSGNSFGLEAVGVLLDAMEKYRKNFVVIFAGYEKEMQVFLDMNSGLRSRISQSFHFESYTPHELAHMLKNVAAKNGFKVEKSVWVPFQRYMKIRIQDPIFGNGRYVRQFFEDCKKSHIMNYSSGKYGEDKKFVITLEDVEPLLEG